MPWDVNQLTQNFMQSLPNPGAAFQQGQDESYNRRVAEANNAFKAEQQTMQLQRDRQKQADVAAAIANPSPQAFADLQLRYPEDREAFKAAWDTRDGAAQKADLRQLSAIHGYLNSGQADRAKAVLQQRIDADKAAGRDTAEDQQFLESIDADPAKAAGFSAYMIAQLAGPEKLGDTLKNVGEYETGTATRPATIQKAEAEASKATTEAQYAPQVVESDLATKEAQRERWQAQTQNEIETQKIAWANYGLNQDRLATETQLKLDELDGKGTQMTDGSRTIMNGAVLSAQTNQALADRAADLADRFAAADMSGGWAASARETMKGAFGAQDPVTGLRNAYKGLINSQAMRNLPPGPATDKDIQLAKEGFPPASASKEHIVSFLRGMAKMQNMAAQADDRRANWVATNGDLAPARRDMDVGGVRVPAGTSFSEFNANSVKRGKAGAAPVRGYLDRYGR